MSIDTTTNTTTTPGLARRHFTEDGVHPYDTVTWGRTDAVIKDWKTGEPVFQQLGVEFPAAFDPTGVNIVASKYFRGTLGTPERESSLRQVIDRIVDTITAWGMEHSYYDIAGAAIHGAELKHLMVHQMVAFNSPVWFNIGVKGVPQQSSACFILDVEDDMADILEWYSEEGVIFKGGSGAGVNLSRIRSSKENVRGGGRASGPVTFMRGADASAGTIKSGGKTRRAAKMVILDADHPDIEEFIWCKAIEERKARTLRDAGWDMGVDGKDAFSIQYQNANNSVRVTDAFMQAVVDNAEWALTARSTGEVIETVPARQIWRAIAEATHECADPGLQFDTTIERWNTTPSVKLRASNPCSEHIRADNSSCNLASLNLLAFLDADGRFDIESFAHACQVTFLAQDILICGSDFPTQKITDVTHQYRDLGLGYANLGALLMACGMPYDSDEGRTMAAAISGILTGSAYTMSARIAGHLEPFPAFEANRDGALGVMRQHRDAATNLAANGHWPGIDALVRANGSIWDRVVAQTTVNGLRNAQATVLAPTGTISFAMGCDTTGVEPAFSLVTYKTLVGGGTLKLTIKSVERALRGLGYSSDVASGIVAHLVANDTVVGAPGLNAEHLAVFATAVGDNEIAPSGHVDMMAAVQPFISGAISKTVNLPGSTTIEEIEAVHLDAWKQGIKCLAIYRDGSKVGQPLSTTDGTETVIATVDVQAMIDEAVAKAIHELRNAPARETMPKECSARRVEFNIGGLKGWLTVSEYADGRPGELFVQVSKAGSTLQGLVNSWSKMVSKALQYGVPLESIVQDFANTKFEPAGMTGVRDVPMATSLLDFVVKFLAVRYLAPEVRTELGIFTTAERTEYVTASTTAAAVAPTVDVTVTGGGFDADAPMCPSDGTPMVRAGACFSCPACGNSSGCS